MASILKVVVGGVIALVVLLPAMLLLLMVVGVLLGLFGAVLGLAAVVVKLGVFVLLPAALLVWGMRRLLGRRRGYETSGW